MFPSSSSVPNATQFNASRLSYACRPLQTNGQLSSNNVAFAAQPESLLTIFLVSNNVICSLHIVTEQRTQRSRAGRWTPLTSPPAGGSANGRLCTRNLWGNLGEIQCFVLSFFSPTPSCHSCSIARLHLRQPATAGDVAKREDAISVLGAGVLVGPLVHPRQLRLSPLRSPISMRGEFARRKIISTSFTVPDFRKISAIGLANGCKVSPRPLQRQQKQPTPRRRGMRRSVQIVARSVTAQLTGSIVPIGVSAKLEIWNVSVNGLANGRSRPFQRQR